MGARGDRASVVFFNIRQLHRSSLISKMKAIILMDIISANSAIAAMVTFGNLYKMTRQGVELGASLSHNATTPRIQRRDNELWLDCSDNPSPYVVS